MTYQQYNKLLRAMCSNLACAMICVFFLLLAMMVWLFYAPTPAVETEPTTTVVYVTNVVKRATQPTSMDDLFSEVL